MKRILKALAGITIIGFLFSCDVYLLPLETTYDTIDLTNDSGRIITHMFILPTNEYYGVSKSTYDFNYYSSKYSDSLGAEYFYDEATASIDLSEFSENEITIVCFSSTFNWTISNLDYYDDYVYVIDVDRTETDTYSTGFIFDEYLYDIHL